MRKTYSINEFLEVAKKKIFSDLLNNAPLVNIFEVVKLGSGDYLPVSQMKSGSFGVYGGGGRTNQTHFESNVSGVTLGIGRVGARCGCVFKIEGPAWVTDNALYASYISKDYDLDFLMHYLNFANLNQYANTAAQPVIGLKRISNVSIPKIDIVKQREIAELLLSISNGSYSVEKDDNFNLKKVINIQQGFSDISDNLELCNKHIGNLRSAILREAVQGKLVPQDSSEGNAQDLLDQIQKERKQSMSGKKSKKSGVKPIDPSEIPFEIPENWMWCRLADISTIVGGGTPSSGRPDYYAKNGIPWLTPADMKNMGKYVERGSRDISDAGYKNSSAQLMPEGSVIFSSRAPIGYVSIAKNPLTTNQGFKSLIPHIKEMSEYLYYFLSFAGKGINDAAGGTTFKEVSGKEVANVITPLPPLPEQIRIVQKIDELIEKLKGLEISIAESKDLSERLLKVGLKEVFNS